MSYRGIKQIEESKTTQKTQSSTQKGEDKTDKIPKLLIDIWQYITVG